jgi:hypothetical protein
MFGSRHSILAAFLCLSSCANIDSISRRTELPGDGQSSGRAIHLDAKQRLVFAKSFGAVCAEPSPDALTAFASSLGAGVSIPSQGAGSLAQAFNTTAGSIGLRTQSITLMRDSLYRICEAYYSRAITGPAVMELLARSQDLTAAILSVEQLTGAVAAHQVILGGEASAASSSNLAFSQGLLENARENEMRKNTAVTEAKTDLESKEAALLQKTAERDKKKAEVDAAAAPGSGVEATQLTQLRGQLDSLNGEVNTISGEVGTAKGRLQTAEALAEEAKKTTEAIERNHDTALTDAAATAAGQGIFGSPVSTVKLDAASTQHIASAVTSIIQSVINKNYIVDGCLALMTDNPPLASRYSNANDWKVSFDEWKTARDKCLTLLEYYIRAGAAEQPTPAQTEPTSLVPRTG